MVIFIDSSVLCAFGNIDDVHNEKARKIIGDLSENKYGGALITGYVFDEVVSVTLRKSNKDSAVNLGMFILDSEIFITNIDSEIFQKSWELFRQLERFSFTDCSILAFMKTFGISKIATFDKEFKKINWLEIVDS